MASLCCFALIQEAVRRESVVHLILPTRNSEVTCRLMPGRHFFVGSFSVSGDVSGSDHRRHTPIDLLSLLQTGVIDRLVSELSRESQSLLIFGLH